MRSSDGLIDGYMMQREMPMRADMNAVLVADDPIARIDSFLAVCGLNGRDSCWAAIKIELARYCRHARAHSGGVVRTFDMPDGFNRFG